MKQLYHKDDLVKVTKLPHCMSHFKTGLAYIGYSYADMHGREDQEPEYALLFLEHGFSAWYPQHLLTLIKRRKKCAKCGSSFRQKP